MVARVMLAVGAVLGFGLYVMVLAVAAVPMLIVTVLRLAGRRPEPAPPAPLPIVSLEGVTIPQPAKEELAAR
jgi:hypothetical protein